jgi:hypothetical protein
MAGVSGSGGQRAIPMFAVIIPLIQHFGLRTKMPG